jgi:hypothetical protein
MQTILYFAAMNITTLYRGSFEKRAKKIPIRVDREGGDKWTRTTDSRIFSPMLYQLSYITDS